MTKARPLAERVAVISGAGRGLGREYALYFAGLGAKLVLNDLTGAPDVADEIRTRGGEAVVHVGDIATWDGAQAMIDLAASTYGRIDTLINNAAMLRVTPARRMTIDDWEQMLAGNLMTTVCPTHAAIQFWNGEDAAGRTVQASIMNMTSENALAAYPGRPAYTTGKAGVAALTLGLAQELASLGVRVKAISPSARTPMSQQTQSVVDRMRAPDDPEALDRYDPKQVAPFVAYASLPDTTLTGGIFRVYGGSIVRYVGWKRGPELTSDRPWTIDDLQRGMTGEMVAMDEGGDATIRAHAISLLATLQ
jgi:NAD(P)-dependent dehydrogenase (short-subunit alcohol dehydrogenase family)